MIFQPFGVGHHLTGEEDVFVEVPTEGRGADAGGEQQLRRSDRIGADDDVGGADLELVIGLEVSASGARRAAM